ncbi:MAG: hypothetical protein DRP74_08595, partial [Candidatus Omnitrophota bacterium]
MLFRLSTFLKLAVIVLIAGLLAFFFIEDIKINFGKLTGDLVSHFLAAVEPPSSKEVPSGPSAPAFSNEPYLTINAETDINAPLNVKETITVPFLTLGKGAFKTTLTSSQLTADRTYTFPDISGTVCLTGGNCVGIGGEVTSSGGIPGRLAKFLSSRRIGASSIEDFYAGGAAITIDSAGNVGIGISSPETRLEVAGDFLAEGDIFAQKGVVAQGNLLVEKDVGIGVKNPAYPLDVKGKIHATGDICTDLRGGKCLSQLSASAPFVVGGGGISGSGSINYLPIWTDSDSLGNSIVSQSGTSLTVSGDGIFEGYLIGIDSSGAPIRFATTSGGYYVGFKAPSDLSTTTIYTWPADYGTNNYVLTTDGSGQLAWTGLTGGIDAYGSPAAGQVAFFYDSDTIMGDSSFAWSTTSDTLTTAGTIAANTFTGPSNATTTIQSAASLTEVFAATSTYALHRGGEAVLAVDSDGGVSLNARGANQNIALTPSGAGYVQLIRPQIEVGTSFPASATSGQMFFNANAGQLYVYSATSSKWQADRTTATKIVAASNSQNKEKADYVCDGANDESEIEAALNALPTNGGLVFLLEGIYNIGSTIDIAKSNVTLMGSGRATILKLDANLPADEHCIKSSGGGLNNIVIRDIQIDGNKSNQSNSQSGIMFEADYDNWNPFTDISLVNLYIHDMSGNGINFIDGVERAFIKGNRVENSYYGIYLADAFDSIITENQVFSNDIHGISLEIWDWYAPKRIVVSDNVISSSTYQGIYSNPTYYSTIANNISRNNGGNGMEISGSYNAIVGNVAKENGDSGVYIWGDKNAIVGNNAKDNSDYGIYCNGENNYIASNELSDNASGAINDAGTGTTIQQRDWFEVEASSTQTALTVTQSGAGYAAVFTGGNVGVGTTGPSAKLTISDGAILASGSTGGTPASGAGTRMMWVPAKAAFRAGYVNGTQWDDANIGGFSTAMGFDTTASGLSSTAMGWSTTASGMYSTAMGRGIEASGNYSIAIALNDQNGTVVSQDNTMAIMGGNVGVGTTTPAAKLTVTQSGTGDIVNLYDSSNKVFQVADGGEITAWRNATLTGGNLTVGPLSSPSNLSVATSSSSGSCATGTTYYYRVTAVNSNGETLGCAEVSTSTGDATALDVSWSAVAGATGYKVYRHTSSISDGASVALVDNA